MSIKRYLDELKGNSTIKTISKKTILKEQEIPEIHQKIKDFFISKEESPTDKEIHALASEMGIDEHELENHIYMILNEVLKSVGKHKHVPDNEFDQEQLKIGIEIEKEHTDSPILAKEISKDHLAEIPDYYTRLVKMEKEAGIE
jgi:hypothetical protein